MTPSHFSPAAASAPRVAAPPRHGLFARNAIPAGDARGTLFDRKSAVAQAEAV
jgi:hypothetical protein